MPLRLGLVGRGYWGNVYAKELSTLGILHWQAGRDWEQEDFLDPVDGLVIASSSESHYEVAKRALEMKLPVLIEKPVCLTSAHAQELIDLGGIVFAGHTRLYSPLWRLFRDRVGPVDYVEAYAGGVNATNPDAELNWWVHLAAMCWDLGFDPEKAVFHVTEEKQPLRFIANGQEFRDGPPGAMAVLLTEFCEAIARGLPNNEGLRLGLKTIQYVENHKCPSLTTPA